MKTHHKTSFKPTSLLTHNAIDAHKVFPSNELKLILAFNITVAVETGSRWCQKMGVCQTLVVMVVRRVSQQALMIKQAHTD